MTDSTAPLLEAATPRRGDAHHEPAGDFNALGEEMLDALQAAFDRLADDARCAPWCWPAPARPSAPATT
jgi:hypothetical protein